MVASNRRSSDREGIVPLLSHRWLFLCVCYCAMVLVAFGAPLYAPDPSHVLDTPMDLPSTRTSSPSVTVREIASGYDGEVQAVLSSVAAPTKRALQLPDGGGENHGWELPLTPTDTVSAI